MSDVTGIISPKMTYPCSLNRGFISAIKVFNNFLTDGRVIQAFKIRKNPDLQDRAPLEIYPASGRECVVFFHPG
jgi:hypothetical protein